LISLNQIHAHTCYQSHRGNGSQKLQRLSAFFNGFPIFLNGFPIFLNGFLQRLFAFFNGFPSFLNGFPLSSTAFVTSTTSQNTQGMIILTHT
jgi:hypothetical protein